MTLLLLLLLSQTGGPSKPRHLLQCDDARRLVEALTAAGVLADAQGVISLPALSCGLASGPPGARVFSCTQPGARGEAARRLWDALAATRIQASAAMMNAVFHFSAVRCAPTPRGMECSLTNEMQAGVGDLRGERLVKPRASCPEKD